MEKTGYVLLAIVALVWIAAMIYGMVAAFPAGLLGLVRGNTIRARHVGKDIVAGLRTVVGGEISEYTKMLAESREQAIDRMMEHAKEKGADGIVCVRFTTSAVTQGSAELLAYGTAARLRRK